MPGPEFEPNIIIYIADISTPLKALGSSPFFHTAGQNDMSIYS